MIGGTLLLEALVYGFFGFWLLALPLVALVTALKERWLYFSAGWVVLGIPWFIAALTLADSGSGWARRFYGPERMARAAGPARHSRPARVTAIWLSGSLALLLAIGFPIARPTPVIGVDGWALQSSVGGEGFAGPCRHGHGRTWTCGVSDSGPSDAVPYIVEMRRLGCWVAVRPYPERSSWRPRSGCITIWDLLRPSEAIL